MNQIWLRSFEYKTPIKYNVSQKLKKHKKNELHYGHDLTEKELKLKYIIFKYILTIIFTILPEKIKTIFYIKSIKIVVHIYFLEINSMLRGKSISH